MYQFPSSSTRRSGNMWRRRMQMVACNWTEAHVQTVAAQESQGSDSRRKISVSRTHGGENTSSDRNLPSHVRRYADWIKVLQAAAPSLNLQEKNWTCMFSWTSRALICAVKSFFILRNKWKAEANGDQRVREEGSWNRNIKARWKSEAAVLREEEGAGPQHRAGYDPTMKTNTSVLLRLWDRPSANTTSNYRRFSIHHLLHFKGSTLVQRSDRWRDDMAAL